MRWPFASKLSALTALNVPTPPATAQFPAEIPLEMATPLPPSTSGSTSAPPIRIALIAFMAQSSLKGREGLGSSRLCRAVSRQTPDTPPATGRKAFPTGGVKAVALKASHPGPADQTLQPLVIRHTPGAGAARHLGRDRRGPRLGRRAPTGAAGRRPVR